MCEQLTHLILKLTPLLAECWNFKIQFRDPRGGRVCLHHFSVHVLDKKETVLAKDVSNKAREIARPSLHQMST